MRVICTYLLHFWPVLQCVIQTSFQELVHFSKYGYNKIKFKKKFLISSKAVFIGIHGIRRLKRDNKIKIYPKIHGLKEVSCLKIRFCLHRGRWEILTFCLLETNNEDPIRDDSLSCHNLSFYAATVSNVIADCKDSSSPDILQNFQALEKRVPWQLGLLQLD